MSYNSVTEIYHKYKSLEETAKKTVVIVKSSENNKKVVKLTLIGKDYSCFQTVGKTAREEQSYKSRALLKVAEYILISGTFEQQNVTLKDF